jgi:1-acyl-sn-glycerol-3-phosphate acyltransferase
MVFYFLASGIAWLLILMVYVGFFPAALAIWLFTVLFDRKLRLLHKFTSFWGVFYIWVNPFWRISISGKEKIQPNTTYVMVSNHQSLADILAVYRIYAHFKWVAKRELFRIPILGWTLKLNNYIPVDRANRSSHLRMMKQCEDNLAQGNSLMIFPEGTRSKDGEIQAFKEGAFKLAAAAKVPILPILLNGTREALPHKGIMFTKVQKMTIKILDPIPYEAFANSSPKETMNKVHDIMVEEFKKQPK